MNDLPDKTIDPADAIYYVFYGAANLSANSTVCLGDIILFPDETNDVAKALRIYYCRYHKLNPYEITDACTYLWTTITNDNLRDIDVIPDHILGDNLEKLLQAIKQTAID